MKIIRSFLITIIFLLVCNVGVLADTVSRPTGYLDQNGNFDRVSKVV